MGKSSTIAFCSLIVLGICVSKIKYEVVFMRRNLNKINEEIIKITDDLRVYNAEWSYLNDPKRLMSLALKYLPEMKPIKYKQILRYNEFINTEYENQSNTRRQAVDGLLDSLIQ